MPPRTRLRSLADLQTIPSSTSVCTRCRYARTASTAAATATASSSPVVSSQPPIHETLPQARRYSPITPPCHRDAAYRKSQLLRSYVSLLQTTPLIVLFQHNNLKALEWASIRRELVTALQKVDDAQAKLYGEGDSYVPLADSIKLSVIRTNIFEPALRITEYYKPKVASSSQKSVPVEGEGIEDEKLDPSLTHALSRAAWQESKNHVREHPLTPLLTGPIATLTFPSVSPAHLKAALSILSPQAPLFPAPTRRANPGYHEPAVQDGLKKILLLGARIDGQVFDFEGTRWVGSVDGGIHGLRAQLVAMLQGLGAGITTTLEAASRNLWFTVKGRRRMLEDDGKPAEEGESQKE